MKKLKKVKRTLSDKEKINYIQQYIRQTTQIVQRNLLIQKTIERFGRNANEMENPNFIYQKQTEDTLFCVHYRYLCKTHKEPEAFLTLRSKYGMPPTEGMICCKICGEYICQEEETTFQGYTEGAVSLEAAAHAHVLAHAHRTHAHVRLHAHLLRAHLLRAHRSHANGELAHALQVRGGHDVVRDLRRKAGHVVGGTHASFQGCDRAHAAMLHRHQPGADHGEN